MLEVVAFLDQMDVDDVVRDSQDLILESLLMTPRPWTDPEGQNYQVFLSINAATKGGSLLLGSARAEVDYKDPGNIWLDRDDLFSQSVTLDERGMWLVLLCGRFEGRRRVARGARSRTVLPCPSALE